MELGFAGRHAGREAFVRLPTKIRVFQTAIACGLAIVLHNSASLAQESPPQEPQSAERSTPAPVGTAPSERATSDAPLPEAEAPATGDDNGDDNGDGDGDNDNDDDDDDDNAPFFRKSWFPEIHGFVSQGFLKTSKNNYLGQSERGSFEFTEVGVNLTSQVTDRFRIGMQLFARDLGPVGDYKPQFDWFYLDYRFFDWLGIRAGRTKIPFGLYNEINDIDAARVPILLPQSVYPIENRDFLLAQTGLEIYGRIPLSKAGALEYQLYGGTIFLDTSDLDDAQDFDAPYVVGGRALWETPLDGLRAGMTFQSLRFDYNLVLTPAQQQGFIDAGLLPQGASNLVAMDFPVRMWVASVEYAAHDLLLAAEYGRWWATLSTDTLPIPAIEAENERFYVMGSYRVAPWFTPGAYYSVVFPDVTDRSGRENQQHDLALTLRFDPIENWLVKFEGHYMSGTAALNKELNGGTELSELTKNWALFMFKTTGYF